MKKALIFVLLIGFSFVASAQDTETVTSVGKLIIDNAAELLLAVLALIKIVVRITPTLKDDEVFAKLDKLLEYLLPNIGKKS